MYWERDRALDFSILPFLVVQNFLSTLFGENPYTVSLKILRVEVRDLFSPVSLHSVVHLDPIEIGPVTQNASKNKCIKEHRVLLSLKIICSAQAQHDL